jgi:cytochrome c oxidase cbb3-type subunit 4
MDINDLRSAVTVASLLLFAVIAAWAWWPRNRAAFDAAAQLPFEGDDTPGAGR